MKSLGGIRSILYVVKKARESGGLCAMLRSMRTKNACKTCALGMGGQLGGMTNEDGKFPEFCKKSVQAMSSDMQGAITKEFFEKYSIYELSSMTPRELESCGRLVFPIKAGPLETHFKPVEWDEALGETSKLIKEMKPDRTFYYCSGRSSNEAGFLLQLAARIRGTNNVNNCSYYCHQASGVGLSGLTGSGTATVQLSDLSKCDLIFLIGCNPSSNHPRLLKKLIDLRRRGGKVIVINPLREEGLCNFRVPSDIRSLLFGSKISDVYVQPRIGGDTSILIGIIKWLHENGGIDNDFTKRFSVGFETVLKQASEISWEFIIKNSGVNKETIAEISNLYKNSTSTIFCWAMGITHVKGGVDSVRMIGNVAIARGMIGKEGAGLLPLRGHSNVQGMGSVGVVPKLSKPMVKAIESEFGIVIPEEGGYDTMSSMEAAHKGEVDFALCLGGNLLASNPDTKFAIKAMSKIKNVTYLSTTLNQGHFLGRGIETIILPVFARDEEPQQTTQESMFNFVRRSSGGESRHEGPRSEVDIIIELAKEGVGIISWEKFQDNQETRELIEKCLSGFDSTKEHHITGRTFHKPIFNTPSGKLHARSVKIDELDILSKSQLRLMTIRSEGQFNTVVYEEEDVYRGQTRRDIIMMNKGDVEDMQLCENESIVVRGNSGELEVKVRIVDIAKGNCAMYFPEANVLLSHEVDRESRTPLFKGEIIEIV
ncbi:MAG: FdhF/YdeP family oxidoreductase [Phycisphaerales bacterium]|jgi:molybdopterin-dependent oxidoreductase alpha subunit|nr:FdhF/YdeP family oxidoreductase [Phycisphaerales bacterium]